MRCQHSLQSLAKVFLEMKPIGTLSGLWSGSRRSRSIVSCTITTHQPDFWVRTHPSRDGFDLAIRQEVNGLMALQIHEESAKRSSSPEREIIYSEFNDLMKQEGRMG